MAKVKKTQEEIIREQEEQTVLMRDFGYRTTDSWGKEPFFVPLWDGGYTTNTKCQMTYAEFIEKFRAYCSKR